MRDRLTKKRKRLEALLPLVTSDRASEIRDELRLIAAKLNQPIDATRGPLTEAASAAGVNGVGGLGFQYQAPAGAGRLIRVPFYLFRADFNQLAFVAPEVGPAVITAGGPNAVSETNPVVTVTMPNDASGQRFLTGFQFRTPIISWAALRVVGLETTQVQSPYAGNDPAVAPVYPSPVLPGGGFGGVGYDPPSGRYQNAAFTRYNNGCLFLLVKNLRVDGGPNLLSQEGYIDGAFYDARVNGYTGLRGYPDLVSPSRALIDVAVVGEPLTSMTFSINLVCDILEDDNYGVYKPGPYDRPTTMLRSNTNTPNVEPR